MTGPRDSRFGRAALQSRLVSEADLAACWDRISPEKRTPGDIDRRLARACCERRLLTKWQAQGLLGGFRPESFWFGKYALLDVLGQGGMGRVYLARDSRLGRRVALKVLSRERLNNPRAIVRFRREAQVGAQLQHEHLVRVYDEGEVGGHLYLVMEYVEGKNVGQLIARRGPLPAGMAAGVAMQVAEGLEHAHRKGMVHRDVNPMNILIDCAGTAKLSDLGLAIDLGDQGDAVTREGATVGTFDYLSPEQARHSRAVDIRSDIYSLGCTLYHMLAGRVPFPQPSLPEKLYAHQAREPVALESVVPDLPAGLTAVLHRMMAKRPEDRYATPGEIAEALRPFAGPPATLAEMEAAPEVPIWVEAEGSTDTGERTTQGGPPPATPKPADGEAGDPFDTFSSIAAIDIGPPPRLSDTASGERRDEGPGIRPGVRILIPGAIGALLLAVAAWSIGGRGDAGPGTPGPPRPTPEAAGQGGPDRSDAPKPAAGAPAVVVRWRDDGTETAVPTLADGVRLAGGRQAEVILAGSTPFELSSAKPLVISNGAVVIRAAEGSAPTLHCDLTGAAPAILVNLAGSVTLQGLTLRGEGQPAHPKAQLIRAAGALRLQNCALIGVGSPRPARAVLVEGRRSSFRDCEFRGFETGIEWITYAGSEAAIEDCLFVRRGDPGAAPGWAIAVANRRTRADRGERRLIVEGCTAAGCGLLALTDLAAETPLSVAVRRTVVDGPAVMGWAGAEPFHSGLAWEGRENRYAVGGPSWVAPLDGPPGGPGGPDDWEQWRRAIGEEPGSMPSPAGALVPGDAGEAGPAPEFARAGNGAGIDPARVGPAGGK